MINHKSKKQNQCKVRYCADFLQRIVLILCMLLMLNCSEEQESQKEEIETNILLANKIVKIRGEFSILKDFNTYLKYEAEGEELDDEMRSYYLEKFIEFTVLHQEANKQDIIISDKEFEERIADLKNDLRGEEIKDESYRKLFNDELWIQHVKDTWLVQRYVELFITSAIVVSESEEQAYYNKKYKRVRSHYEYKIRQIMLNDKLKAEEIEQLLKKSPEKFEDQAKEHSILYDGKFGGDIGWYRLELLPEYIQKPLRKLRSGRISKIIETDEGYLIIKLESKKLVKPKSFYDMRSKIQNTILQNKRSDMLEDYIGKLWEEEITETSGIEIYPENLDFIYTPTNRKGRK